VDFPGVVLAEPPAPVSQPDQGLARATLLQVGDGGTPTARLRIEVASSWEAAVRNLPAGIEVRFTPAAAQAAPVPQAAAARELTDVQAVADDTGVSVLLVGGAPLTGKVFTLPDPPRVVVDLPGVVNRVSRRVHPVDSQASAASGSRSSRPSRTRWSASSSTSPASRPTPESTAQGAVLRIGGVLQQRWRLPPLPPRLAAVAQAEPEPAAAQPCRRSRRRSSRPRWPSNRRPKPPRPRRRRSSRPPPRRR
jgi:hypothetical protein